MPKTASTMLSLGTTAPDFSLPGIDGKTVTLPGFGAYFGRLAAR